jgi:uncharacterized protein
MPVTIEQIAGAAVILFVAGTLQSAVGFGFALLATPSLVWLGVPLPVAVSTVAGAVVVQSGVSAHHLRREIPWRTVLVSTAVRLPAVVAGVFVLVWLSRLSVSAIKFAVGTALLVALALLWGCRVAPRERVHAAWSATAFVTSGFVAGVCGMGGPPLVLWVMAHDWSSEKTRAFLFAVYLLACPVYVGLLAWKFGASALKGAGLGVLLGAVVWVGALLGLAVGRRLPKSRLRPVAYILLAVVAVVSMLPQVLDWLGAVR